MFFTVPIAADPASTAAPSSARHHRRAQRPTSARQKRTPSSSFTTRSKTASSALADPMLKDRIAELKAIRDQARADAERADGASDRLGPAHHTSRSQNFCHDRPQAHADRVRRRSGPISVPRSTISTRLGALSEKTGARQTFAALPCFATAGAASLSADRRCKGPRCAAGLRRGVGPL